MSSIAEGVAGFVVALAVVVAAAVVVVAGVEVDVAGVEVDVAGVDVALAVVVAGVDVDVAGVEVVVVVDDIISYIVNNIILFHSVKQTIRHRRNKLLCICQNGYRIIIAMQPFTHAVFHKRRIMTAIR